MKLGEGWWMSKRELGDWKRRGFKKRVRESRDI